MSTKPVNHHIRDDQRPACNAKLWWRPGDTFNNTAPATCQGCNEAAAAVAALQSEYGRALGEPVPVAPRIPLIGRLSA